MRGSDFAELAAFVAVAEHGSFVKAAAVVNASTSSLSKMIRALEDRLGVRLVNRTTRSLALTEAGERLLAQVRPALDELGAAVEAVNAFRDTPAGVLRLNVSSLAATMVTEPILGRFIAAYPEITLDISVADGSIDIVEGRFDAGIRRDKRIDQDMIAIRLTRQSRMVAVASPTYLAKHQPPNLPQDLRKHNCVQFRLADGTCAKWEFEKDHKRAIVPVTGSLIVDKVDLMLRGALEGGGIAYLVEAYVEPYIKNGGLTPVLENWSPHFSGWHIYYASRRQMRAPLAAFIEFVRRNLPS